MLTFETLQENIDFIIAETTAQVEATWSFINEPDNKVYESISSRADYIRNLKNSIESRCFKKLSGVKQDKISAKEFHTYRSIRQIASSFHRISHNCINMAKQMRHFSSPEFIHQFDYKTLFEKVLEGLSFIPADMNAVTENSALNLCRMEPTLDELYGERLTTIAATVDQGNGSFNDGLTAVLIVRYLERIGDEMQLIGEGLLSILIGERIRIHEYRQLQRSLKTLGLSTIPDKLSYKAIWGSRSGCVVGQVQSENNVSIFKEGDINKIKPEMDHLLMWDELMPGLAPKVYNYTEEGNQASLLSQFMSGTPLDELMLTEKDEVRAAALERLLETVHMVWSRSKQDKPEPSEYMHQVFARLKKVRQFHPDLGWSEGKSKSAVKLMEKSAKIEKKHFIAPFSVFIHGDFNLNNIFYDIHTNEIHYVDLFRSRQTDYVQDISVFMVSNFRIPIFDAQVRQSIHANIARILEFALQFAEQNNDVMVQPRLTLAIARSLITSTRFELKASFANTMFERAYELLSQIVAYDGGDWNKFVLPADILCYTATDEEAGGPAAE